MHFSNAFQDLYHPVADCDTATIGTIKSAIIENVGVDNPVFKLTVTFVEDTINPLVCTSENAQAIAEAAGSTDITKWAGTRLRLLHGTAWWPAAPASPELDSTDEPRLMPCVIVQAETTVTTKTEACSAYVRHQRPFTNHLKF